MPAPSLSPKPRPTKPYQVLALRGCEGADEGACSAETWPHLAPLDPRGSQRHTADARASPGARTCTRTRLTLAALTARGAAPSTVPATDSPPTRCGRAASSCRHARAALRARSDGLLAGRRTPRPEMHTPRTRCAHVAHTPRTRHAHAHAMRMPRARHCARRRTHRARAIARGGPPRSRASRRCSSRLPTSPHISPYLPIPPHISHRAVALRSHAPRAARRGHGRGRARPCRARTPNASSWRGRVAPAAPVPCDSAELALGGAAHSGWGARGVGGAGGLLDVQPWRLELR